VVWRGDDLVTCIFDDELVVGPHNVTLTLTNTTCAPRTFTAQCPPGSYGRTGERCQPCPKGGVCAGRGTDPASLPGWYPVARAVFVQCAPAAACSGGASYGNLDPSGVVGCAKNYVGPRCAECRVGS
jgi:hypothetical protein